MIQPVIVDVSPNKENITCNFMAVLKEKEAVFHLRRTAEMVIKKGKDTSQTIVFCNTFNDISAVLCYLLLFLKEKYGGEYRTKMELNKFISNRVMHYIVPCGDIPSKTTNFSVDRYTIPDTSCYCIGHAPTSYRMLLYRAWCCQIVINVRR